MKLKDKIIIIVAITILIIIGLYIHYLVNGNTSIISDNAINSGDNDSNEFFESEVVDLVNKNETYYRDLLISNIVFSINEDKTFIKGKITNNTKKDIKVDMFDVVLLDENDNEIGFVDFYQGGKIKVGKSIDINFDVDYKYENVKALKFTDHRKLEPISEADE